MSCDCNRGGLRSFPNILYGSLRKELKKTIDNDFVIDYIICMNENKDSFEIDGNAVVCTSTSGKKYTITKNSCSCAGFGFRKNCRHFSEANKLGLIKKIEKKSIQNGTINNRGPQLIESRKKAIKSFIEKNGLEAPQSLINVVEPHVTSKMKPERFIEIVRRILEVRKENS